MKTFIHEDFILKNQAAKVLYHKYAEQMPIFDFHCHLNPKEIYENKSYENITQLWLYADHYKWRMMRAVGIDEAYITGDAADYDKFMAWAKTVPQCIGNPIYHWVHLELKRYFGIEELLNEQTAPAIWEECNKKLKEKEFTPQAMILSNQVKALCTTDDPIDDLAYHKLLKEEFTVKVLPTYRPDKAIHIENAEYTDWIEQLTKSADMDIQSMDDLKTALKQRAEYFKSVGCVLSDQSFADFVYCSGTKEEAEAVFQKAINNEALTKEEVSLYQTNLMLYLGSMYLEIGFSMQLHLGVIRNNNSKRFNQIGADTGFDAIGDEVSALSLVQLLDGIEQQSGLPKTVIYCLNPGDNEKLISIAGCYQNSGIVGKMQFGSAWWFLDHKDGMEDQLKSLGNIGLLSGFIGMLTDSRSFLSYTRHEYFRRILCNLLGKWIDEEEVPQDYELLGTMVQNICYNNSMNYFGLND